MIKIEELPGDVFHAIASNVSDDPLTPEEVASLRISSPRELMDRYLQWNGIIGYTDQIIEVLDAIRAAEVK